MSAAYTNSLHGSRLGTGYVLSGRVQRVGRHQGLLASNLGYDWARSRMASPALLLGWLRQYGIRCYWLRASAILGPDGLFGAGLPI